MGGGGGVRRNGARLRLGRRLIARKVSKSNGSKGLVETQGDKTGNSLGKVRKGDSREKNWKKFLFRGGGQKRHEGKKGREGSFLTSGRYRKFQDQGAAKRNE